MRWSGRLALSLGAALGCAAPAGCVLDLPAVCGDGHVDDGEDCDPAAVGANNGDKCDPETCRPRSTIGCGNGKFESGEECDLADFGNKTCPSGKGFLSCTADCELDESTCDPCGNGRLDPTEECDPKLGTLLQPTPCTELASPSKPYTSGVTIKCTEKCLWYRGECGFCGNGVADDAEIVDLDFNKESEPEVCDGLAADDQAREEYCEAECPSVGRRPTCSPPCNDECSSFEPGVQQADLRCCWPAPEDCPAADNPVPCCAGYALGLDDPFDTTQTCELRFITDDMGQTVQKKVCK